MSDQMIRTLRELVIHIREDIPEEQMSKHLLECVEDAEMFFAEEDQVARWDADDAHASAPSGEELFYAEMMGTNKANVPWDEWLRWAITTTTKETK